MCFSFGGKKGRRQKSIHGRPRGLGNQLVPPPLEVRVASPSIHLSEVRRETLGVAVVGTVLEYYWDITWTLLLQYWDKIRLK